jgi:leader peptidase (prepilin peptidase)/N-methyltransferase
LPDALTLTFAGLGLMAAPWITGVTLRDGAIGAVAGYGALFAIAIGYRALRGREGLGLGDAKLLGALGAWFGWQALPFILLASSLLGLLLVIIMAMVGRSRIDRHAMLPLGTFLCVAALPGWWISRMLLF